ncbi:hypothetical protein KSP40_PGU009599 [Platanthera guangdongensis]|uniref:Ribosomal protein S21 n=1 Tax=Platanthera guangdongensis TaxID=2320717 RepID=A0ABR2MKT0_9ASPA
MVPPLNPCFLRHRPFTFCRHLEPFLRFASLMAVTWKHLQLTFPKNPSIPSSLYSCSAILPAVSHPRFPKLSTAVSGSFLATPSLLSSTSRNTDSLEEVVNPALHNANFLFFSSGYNVQIFVKENEPEEVLLRRFRREVSKAGVIQECKRRRFFENKREELKRKKREAGRRNRWRYLLDS